MLQSTARSRWPSLAARLRVSPGARTLISVAAAHCMIDCSANVWPIFKKLAGLDLAAAGMLVTVTTIVSVGLQPLFGFWADHGHRRRLILVGAAIGPLIVLLGPISRAPQFMHHWSGYATMALILLASGLGISIFHPPAASAVGDTSTKRRSTMVGLFVTTGMVGLGSSHLVFSTVYLRTSGHTELLLIPAALVIVLAIRWCRPVDPPPSAVDWRDGVRRFAGLFRVILIPWLIQVLSTASLVALHFMLPELTQARGQSQWWVNGGATLLLIGGNAATVIPAGHLADRRGRRHLLAGCLTLTIGLYYGLVLAPSLATWQFALLVFALGACVGPVNALMVAYAQQRLPENSSTATGIMLGMAWAAAAPATWIVGFLVQTAGLSLPTALAWMGLPTCIGLCLMLLMVIRRDL